MIAMMFALTGLPTPEQCQTVALEPEAAYVQSIGLQGFIYGYPIVDMLTQQHNETNHVRQEQPVTAPVNRIAVYPGVLTPATQGELRAPNADTLYLNAWFDLSTGPVLLDVPAMGKRYYTLAFMDLYAKPHHLGTRTNGGKATRYALIGPSGGEVPDGYVPFNLPTDTAWMLGRVMVDGPEDEPEAKRLAQAFVVSGSEGPPVADSAPMRPMESLLYFELLNRGLKSLPAIPGEEALMALFDSAGFGPGRDFDMETLSPDQAKGLGCALLIGPQILSKHGFKPTQSTNGWLLSNAVADPGFDYLLRAEITRGGYVNAPIESIYPASISDSSGARLSGEHHYRIRFEESGLPPVDAFWSITSYDMKTGQLNENPIRRYAISDRTEGLHYGTDGSLEIFLSASEPAQGVNNWLPVPAGAFHVVTRLYLPRPEALDGRYVLPPIKRIK